MKSLSAISDERQPSSYAQDVQPLRQSKVLGALVRLSVSCERAYNESVYIFVAAVLVIATSWAIFGKQSPIYMLIVLLEKSGTRGKKRRLGNLEETL